MIKSFKNYTNLEIYCQEKRRGWGQQGTYITFSTWEDDNTGAQVTMRGNNFTRADVERAFADLAWQ